MMMIFQKRVKGEDEEWREIGEALTRRFLANHYTYIDAIIEDMKAEPGRIINTPYSLYRCVEEEK